MLQEVNKVLILLVGSCIKLIGASLTSSIGGSSVAHHRWLVSFIGLELFDLLLQSLDDLLAEVGPLGQLLLDLLMDLDIPLESVDLCLHLAVLVEQLLGLLRLVLELSGQLMVLQDGQPGGGLQLLVVQRQQVGLGFLDLVKHLLSELFGGLDLLPLFLVDLGVFHLDLLLKFPLETIHLFIDLLLLVSKLLQVLIGGIEVIDLALKLLHLLLKLLFLRLNLSLIRGLAIIEFLFSFCKLRLKILLLLFKLGDLVCVMLNTTLVIISLILQRIIDLVEFSSQPFIFSLEDSHSVHQLHVLDLELMILFLDVLGLILHKLCHFIGFAF